MATQAFQVLHAIPGRLRVKIPKLKDDPALAHEFQHKLSHIAVVQEGVHHLSQRTPPGWSWCSPVPPWWPASRCNQ